MSILRCLHTADLHLDAHFPALGEREEARRADFLKTFERLITLAIKSEVHLFLVAGDLFDTPRPAPAIVARVQAAFQRLTERGILPVVIPGTHDAVVSRDAVFLREAFPGVLLAAATVEEPVRIEAAELPVWLYGFGYRAGAPTGLLDGLQRRAGEGVHIGLLHGSRIGSPEWNYRPKDLPFELEQLLALQLDYVALGHYHGFELLKDAQGRIRACYPGSPEGKRFGENGPRQAALVTISDGMVDVRPLAVQSRILDERTLDLTGVASHEAAAAAIAGLADPELLLKLQLTGTVECPLQNERLLELCRERFFHLELSDRTRLYDSALVRAIAGEETIRGHFVRRVRRLIDAAAPEERQVLEDAFREVLARFGAGSERSA